MDYAPTPPPDPVVMDQQIQALIVNVQELMKQNEELKHRARLEGSNHVVVVDMTRRLGALKTIREKMQPIT